VLSQHVQPGVLNGSALRHVVPWKASRTVRCASCDITLNSHQQAKQHYGGKAHQRRLQKIQQQKELRPPNTQIETPATEGPKKDAADAERKSSEVDDVASEQAETTDTASITGMQDSTGEFTSIYCRPRHSSCIPPQPTGVFTIGPLGPCPPLWAIDRKCSKLRISHTAVIAARVAKQKRQRDGV